MLLLLPSLALAAPPWADLPPLSAPPQTLLDAAAELVGDRPVEILFEDVRITFGEGRTVARSEHMVYILRDPSEAPYWTRADAGWSPWYQERPDVTARVIRPDGQTFLLDPSTFVEEASRDVDATLLDDRRVMYAPLPQVTAGSVVELVITEKPIGTFGPGGAGARERVVQGEFAWPKRVTVEAPAKMPLRWSGVEVAAEPVTTTKAGLRRLVFELPAVLEPYERGEWAPPSRPEAPFLDLSTGASWEAESAAYYGLVADRLSGKDLAPLLAAGAGKTGVDQVEALLNALRARVRYTGVEFGESAIVPAPPDTVLGRGWGDCKEQAGLLVALLGASGVQAEMALIRPGAGEDVAPEHPGLGSFSHAIVHVPATTTLGELWIDPSVPQLGARETPLEELGHHALLVRPKGGALVQIAFPGVEANQLTTVTETVFVPGLKIPIDLRLSGRGAVVMPHRPPWGKDATTHFRERFEEDGSLKFTDIKHTGVARTDEPFDLRAKGTTEAVLFEEWSDNLGVRGTLMLPRDIAWNEIDEERTAPYLVLPSRMEQVVRLHLPDGYVVDEAPEPLTFESDGVRVEVTRVRTAAIEELRVVTMTKKNRYEPAEARALAEAIAAGFADWNGKIRVVAEPIQLVEDDKPAEAVRRARELVASHPGDPAYHVILATVLSRGGFRDLALAELERAVAARPGDADLLTRRAFQLASDPVGRRGVPPFDSAAARASAKACLAVDAKDTACRGSLAYGLLLDPEGRMFGPGAPYAELETWGATLADDKDAPARLAELRIAALMQLGRYPEAKKLAAKEGMTRLVVAATALGESATAAAAQVTRTSEYGRWRLASDAADELERLRRYPEALAVIKAGLGKSTETERVARVTRLGASRRWEDRAPELGAPSEAALRFLHAVGSGATRPALAAFASPELLAWLDPAAGHGDWWSHVRPMVKSWLGADSPDAQGIDIALDHALAAGTFAVEGDEKTGWKVSIRDEDWRRPLRILLAKGKKGPEVRAFTLLDQTVSMEAARRVKAGDIAGAAWWIDAWQQDEPAGEDAAVAARYRPIGDVDPTRVKVAAALLAWPGDPGALDVLATALPTETGDRRLLVGKRLVSGLVDTEKWDALAAVIDPLLAEFPADRDLTRAKVELETSRQGWAAAQKALDIAIAAHPRDVWLRTAAVEVSLGTTDGAAAIAALLATLDAGDTSSRELNEAAWTLLFIPGNEAKALTLVEKAVDLRGAGDGTRHTLAMAQLANGKVGAAVKTLQDEVKRSGEVDNLPAYWWLVRGRIAEAYGLTEEAMVAYRNVPPEPGAHRSRSDQYAADRIAVLGGGS
ncbi:MAG: DUF3857 and transglutaminase domain-containing protein [Pseudomonadota bacterium]|nr:DUF3857 and transglutaminase domain-containing protein [Pseudomonadota bacterium]